MTRIIILLSLLFSTIVMAMNTSTLSGFVLDAVSRESISGANIFLPGRSLGSSSNGNGYYVIPNLPAGEYSIKCQFVGYKPIEKKLKLYPGEQKKLDIFLEEDVLLGELIETNVKEKNSAQYLFRQPISKIRLSSLQIKQIPQVLEADVLRALQNLPGIMSLSDFSSALYVRGGTPDQNLYLIDGADVYNPEHAFGFFSTFNTDAVKQVNMFKGGFGAAYGGRLSSVLDVTYADGNRKKWGGNASLNMLSGKTSLFMPLGEKGSVFGSFRRTYFDQTAAKLINDIPKYYFYDANIKTVYHVNPTNKIVLSLFSGRDVMDFIVNKKSEVESGFDYNWGNRTGSFNWTRIFSPRLFAKFWITNSRFASDFDYNNGFDIDEKNTLNDLTFKGNSEYAVSNKLSVETGFEYKALQTSYKLIFSNSLANVRQGSRYVAGFGTMNWKPAPVWDIAAGLRYNYFSSDKSYNHINPRLQIKYHLSDKSNVKFSSGLYSQFLHRISRGFISSLWTVSDKYQKGSRALHLIMGYEKELPGNFSLETEIYYKKLSDIYSFNYNFMTSVEARGFDDWGRALYTDTQGQFNHGNGFARGWEVVIKKERGPVNGWLSYSLSQARVRFDGINQNKAFAPHHDRTSSLKLITSIDVKNSIRGLLGHHEIQADNRWLLGINAVYSSGQPITVPGSAYATNLLPNYNRASSDAYGRVSFTVYPSEINKRRLPYYARMDASITYQKFFKNWSLSAYLQIFNVFNRKNVWFFQYEQQASYTKVVKNISETYMLPFLPTVGINVKF